MDKIKSNMNEVSIIINGVRYDAVSGETCGDCDLNETCDATSYYDDYTLERCYPFATACEYLVENLIFKKSTKSFER